ncbi:NADH dehydrogenase [ubiquinone] 1 beta subcomplex subunit 10 [Buteo buteo]|uniref:NADH dehydrogenase [ubiquinone] 1 beta subcomplex subunit 10 n=1 Tax=Buteo buteo TaxID=30397 RepID=UPI003EBDD3E4
MHQARRRMRRAAPSDPAAGAVWGAAIFSAPPAGPAAAAMPEDRDWEAYKVPPTRTPESERITSVPNPINFIQTVFNYVIDAPVTFVREWIERQQAKNKFYYYHQKFRRVPDLSECLEGDYLCFYEAEAQWRRDRMVDQEIVEIVRERLGACKQREGPNQFQNCAKEAEQLAQVTKAYQDRYGDLGVHGNARTCLMKQKHRMMEERKAKEKASQ